MNSPESKRTASFVWVPSSLLEILVSGSAPRPDAGLPDVTPKPNRVSSAAVQGQRQNSAVVGHRRSPGTSQNYNRGSPSRKFPQPRVAPAPPPKEVGSLFASPSPQDGADPLSTVASLGIQTTSTDKYRVPLSRDASPSPAPRRKFSNEASQHSPRPPRRLSRESSPAPSFSRYDWSSALSGLSNASDSPSSGGSIAFGNFSSSRLRSSSPSRISRQYSLPREYAPFSSQARHSPFASSVDRTGGAALLQAPGNNFIRSGSLRTNQEMQALQSPRQFLSRLLPSSTSFGGGGDSSGHGTSCSTLSTAPDSSSTPNWSPSSEQLPPLHPAARRVSGFCVGERLSDSVIVGFMREGLRTNQEMQALQSPRQFLSRLLPSSNSFGGGGGGGDSSGHGTSCSTLSTAPDSSSTPNWSPSSEQLPPLHPAARSSNYYSSSGMTPSTRSRPPHPTRSRDPSPHPPLGGRYGSTDSPAAINSRIAQTEYHKGLGLYVARQLPNNKDLDRVPPSSGTPPPPAPSSGGLVATGRPPSSPDDRPSTGRKAARFAHFLMKQLPGKQSSKREPSPHPPHFRRGSEPSPDPPSFPPSYQQSPPPRQFSAAPPATNSSSLQYHPTTFREAYLRPKFTPDPVRKKYDTGGRY
ncbi:unnamed protein product [Cyprideis torosa]|uniref:Uncharacterized protein n=1 Tax=Cyprideis torosa TaxID=163714 RepID=A0A7R8ZPU8_9CRUS|nr:unnamed protein product [Cyprideis torosa]CAG0890685.1 unnamed protein product [Cyprideis torosa]